MSDELKPCPFCGEEDPTIERDGKWYYITCRKCECTSDGDRGQSGAEKRWNTRPIEDELRRRWDSALKASKITVVLRGGIDVWGIDFVQWLERQLDTLPGLMRTGKDVSDDYILIHMDTVTIYATKETEERHEEEMQ